MKKNPIGQKALSLLLSLTLILGIFGVDTAGAFAAQSGNAIHLSIDSGNILITDSGYYVGGGAKKDSSAGGYVISGSTTSNTISVQSGTQNITIQNINIEVSACVFSIAKGATVYLTLNGENTLKSGDHAGLEVPGDTTNPASLIITNADSGTLTATGGENSAGIGGNDNEVEDSPNKSGGNITINGGTVIANGQGGAGIGGGYGGAGGNITIKGGIVTVSGYNGAGIGGGQNGSSGSITIKGGIVTATGDMSGAGVGGGQNGSGGDVTISNADTQVTAKGQGGGEDIGSGAYGHDGGILNVSDATVAMLNSDSSLNTNAYKNYSNCYIITGGSETKHSGNVTAVTLLTATLTAQPAETGAVKLAAQAMNGSTPETEGTFSFAYCGAQGNGTIQSDNNGSIDPTTGTASCTWTPPTSGLTVVTAKYTANGYDTLNAVFYYDPDAINLSATGSDGFGYTYGSNTFTINQNGWYVFTGTTSGGTANKIAVQTGVSADVTLRDANMDVHGTSDACAFSIAAGAKVNLTLEGNNTLKSGDDRAGLEVPGNPNNPSENAFLTIGAPSDSDSLTTTGGNEGAGIGGGYEGSGGSITINGGIVEAIGGSSSGGRCGGAGIGCGGDYGTGGSVTIFGAGTQVTAKGQGGGKDIGSGGSSFAGRTLGSGTLTVGNSSTVEPLPVLELQSAGTNAANQAPSRPQFMNCLIQGTSANGISGCYDASGKLWLDITLSMPSSVKVGEPVTLTANVKRHYFNDTVTLPGTVQLYVNSVPFVSSVPIAAGGTAQINWTPSNGSEVSLKAKYMPTATDRYASAESVSLDCTPGKTTPTVSSLPTASAVTVGSPLSASTLSGGTATVLGVFSWVNRNQPVTASKDYQAVFTPNDPTIYNSVFLMVPVNVTAPVTPPSQAPQSSHGTSAPSLPSSVTDTPTSATADLSGAAFPAWVTGVSLSVNPEVTNGAPSAPGNAGIPSDPQGAAVYHLVISQTGLNLIGSPFVYNIKLLDQNGNPITSFTGTVTVKVAIPAGIHGTPHIFRYEESTGTFTDLGATVENGFLIFQTTHFSYYVIAGTGDSVTLDTKNYQLPVGGKYQIGLKLTGSKAASVKVSSTNDKVAAAAKLKSGNIPVTGKGPGTAYIMIDVYDRKNHLLTHASVRVDVKTGIRPRGDPTRQIGVF